MSIDRAVRFWRKVDQQGPTWNGSLCWNWTASKSRKGYGAFWDGANRQAHRVAYELVRGKIPTSLQIDHLCRNRACMNPAHMELVDSRTNTLRGESFAAREARQTRCIHGHEFTPENTRICRGGKRKCRECDRAHTRAWKLAARHKS